MQKFTAASMLAAVFYLFCFESLPRLKLVVSYLNYLHTINAYGSSVTVIIRNEKSVICVYDSGITIGND